MNTNDNNRYIEKMQCYSCVLHNNKIVFPTIVNQVVEMRLTDGYIEKIENSCIDNKKVMHSIFYINDNYYYLENDSNKILDSRNHTCVEFSEISSNIPYLFCAKQFDGLLYILYGDGSLFIDINVHEGLYKYKKIENIKRYISMSKSGIVFADKNDTVRIFNYKTDEKNLMMDAKYTINGVIDCYEDSGCRYFLNTDKVVILDEGDKIKEISIEQKEKYKHIHVLGNNIFLIPNDISNNIKIITVDGNDYVINDYSYPPDIMQFKSEPHQFIRSMEYEGNIVYPMRGINYFVLLLDNDNPIKWIRPNIPKDKASVINKKCDKKVKEGFWNLKDLIEVIVSE